ncbi:hypothetical protein NADFUDRAFT_45967 [Nadsonia fulvescens var. elongata DSM 6958]|uniref:Damage-regulated import facilitator 1 n=1 Tax=Nadsonia fulvescens var. elongata DSM 6958 TaxID=857566 RepID=A0A1E3PMK7_9ASCO|nr:hypothetical protein NADFUDRAFT_45967 [Nadsonia fulvescens var. elongata DSM 6958]
MSSSSQSMRDTKRYITEYFPNTAPRSSPKPLSTPCATRPFNQEGISDDVRQSLQTMGMRIRSNVSRGYKSLSEHSSFQNISNDPGFFMLGTNESSSPHVKRSLDEESDGGLTDNDEDSMTDGGDNEKTHTINRRNLAPLRTNRRLLAGSSASFTAPTMSNSFQPTFTPSVASASSSFTQGYTDNKAKIYYIPHNENTGSNFNPSRVFMASTTTPTEATSSTPALNEMDVDFDDADFLMPKEMIM